MSAHESTDNQDKDKWLSRLLKLEEAITYNNPPQSGTSPIYEQIGSGVVLVSAPHGARTFRNADGQIWHEEDEYTGGLAMLLGEMRGVHVLATVARIDDHDPNHDTDPNKLYKMRVRDVVTNHQIKYVIDLHGAALQSTRMNDAQMVDLGWGSSDNSTISPEHYRKIREIIESRFGADAVERGKMRGFPASELNRTITNFSHTTLKIQAIQIEMKPQVRVLRRRESASLYPSCGEYAAEPDQVWNMIQALVGIIEYLNEEG